MCWEKTVQRRGKALKCPPAPFAMYVLCTALTHLGVLKKERKTRDSQNDFNFLFSGEVAQKKGRGGGHFGSGKKLSQRHESSSIL